MLQATGARGAAGDTASRGVWVPRSGDSSHGPAPRHGSPLTLEVDEWEGAPLLGDHGPGEVGTSPVGLERWSPLLALWRGCRPMLAPGPTSRSPGRLCRLRGAAPGEGGGHQSHSGSRCPPRPQLDLNALLLPALIPGG